MKKFNNKMRLAIVSLVAIAGGAMYVHVVSAVVVGVAPSLGAAASYSALGKAGVTNVAALGTTLSGFVGADTTITGFGAGQGTSGGQVLAPAVNGAEANALTAYNLLVAQTPDPVPITIAGTNTVTPGVWNIQGTGMTGGVLTLSGAGVYIFSSTGSNNIANGSQVLLTNGATACNVFWQIPTSMTIGTGVTMVGTIITNTGLISLGTGSTLNGRAISLVSQVTLDNTQISGPTCGASGGGGGVTMVYPLISIQKVPTPLVLPTGPGQVTYNYTVTNIGTIPMYNVSVTDDKCPLVNFVSGDTNNDLKLDLTETWIYRCTTSLAQTTTNVATAIGYAEAGYGGARSIDTATATVVVGSALPAPLIHVVKVPSVFSLPLGGGVVTYTYTITNPGVVPMSNVSIIDNKCTGLPSQYVGHPGDLNQNGLLDVNETFRFSCVSNLKETTTIIMSCYATQVMRTVHSQCPALSRPGSQ